MTSGKNGQNDHLRSGQNTNSLLIIAKSRDEIGEMMGHSTSQVREHYLASLDMDKTWGINEGLL